MQRQQMTIIIDTEIDCDKWNFDQENKELALKVILSLCVTDAISELQKNPSSEYRGLEINLEYGKPL